MTKTACYVIDASVAAAIGESRSRSSLVLLDALMAARDARLRMIRTAELDDEWERRTAQRSLFLEHLHELRSRNLMGRRALKTLPELKKRLRKVVASQDQEAVLKDAHLVAVAQEVSARVLSLDDKMRGHLARASESRSLADLRPIQWANPSRQRELVADWLRRGAPDEMPRRLGSWKQHGT